MNSVQVLGNLARDPVIRATKTGRSMASFTVAVNRNYVTPQGEQKEITDWVNVVAWGNLAEAVGNSLKKGSRCFAEGRFTTRSYDTPDGQRRWVSEVTANFIAVPLGSHGNVAHNPQPVSTQNAAPGGAGFDQFGERHDEPQQMVQNTMFSDSNTNNDEEIPF